MDPTALYYLFSTIAQSVRAQWELERAVSAILAAEKGVRVGGQCWSWSGESASFFGFKNR